MKTEHTYIYRYGSGLIAAVRMPGQGQVQKRFPAARFDAAIAWRDARLAEAAALAPDYAPTLRERRECAALGVRLEADRLFRVCLGRRGARVQRCFSIRKYGSVRRAFAAALRCRDQVRRCGAGKVAA